MKKAFTLIEILVALAIIALIMGASFSAFSGARASARDAKRKADLESIRSALELYRNQVGYYPNVTSLLTGPVEYMSLVPKDPVSKTDYSYNPVGCTGINCTKYYLCSTLEIVPAATPTPSLSNCSVTCGGTGCQQITTNP